MRACVCVYARAHADEIGSRSKHGAATLCASQRLLLSHSRSIRALCPGLLTLETVVMCVFQALKTFVTTLTQYQSAGTRIPHIRNRLDVCIIRFHSELILRLILQRCHHPAVLCEIRAKIDEILQWHEWKIFWFVLQSRQAVRPKRKPPLHWHCSTGKAS